MGDVRDYTDNNPAWLKYLETHSFPLTEYTRLYLAWNHSGDPKPERLEELCSQLTRLKTQFCRMWQARQSR